MSANEQFPKLVADLGGTNIRFAICRLPVKNNANNQNAAFEIEHVEQFSLRDYEDLQHLVTYYLAEKDVEIRSCCFAIAGPIINGRVKMTNYDWDISDSKLNAILGIDNTLLINDFAAIAHSVPFLNSSQLIDIGGGESLADQPISVFGPGTGLGAAILVPSNKTGDFSVIATEGGHAAISARSDLELAIFDYWRDKGCRINREFFICGNGIERLFESIVAIRGINGQPNLAAPDIQQHACSGSKGPLEQLCIEALSAFCGFLGSAAGDQVLCTGARGGLILAGGILPKCVDFLQHSKFRSRFESKGVMSDYTKQVSTKLIVEPQPGLIGAAACGFR